jgi:hypothetical protein
MQKLKLKNSYFHYTWVNISTILDFIQQGNYKFEHKTGRNPQDCKGVGVPLTYKFPPPPLPSPMEIAVLQFQAHFLKIDIWNKNQPKSRDMAVKSSPNKQKVSQISRGPITQRRYTWYIHFGVGILLFCKFCFLALISLCGFKRKLRISRPPKVASLIS